MLANGEHTEHTGRQSSPRRVVRGSAREAPRLHVCARRASRPSSRFPSDDNRAIDLGFRRDRVALALKLDRFPDHASERISSAIGNTSASNRQRFIDDDFQKLQIPRDQRARDYVITPLAEFAVAAIPVHGATAQPA